MKEDRYEFPASEWEVTRAGFDSGGTDLPPTKIILTRKKPRVKVEYMGDKVLNERKELLARIEKLEKENKPMSEKKATIGERYPIVREIIEIETGVLREKLSGPYGHKKEFEGQLGNWLKIESILDDLMTEWEKMKKEIKTLKKEVEASYYRWI